jgi:hypothetical protein
MRLFLNMGESSQTHKVLSRNRPLPEMSALDNWYGIAENISVCRLPESLPFILGCLQWWSPLLTRKPLSAKINAKGFLALFPLPGKMMPGSGVTSLIFNKLIYYCTVRRWRNNFFPAPLIPSAGAKSGRIPGLEIESAKKSSGKPCRIAEAIVSLRISKMFTHP